MRLRRLVLVTLAFLSLTTPVAAADLCVCPASSGDDSTVKASISYSAGNFAGSTCWTTIGRAFWGNASRSSPNTAQAAAAGDTVYICAGTYSVGAGLNAALQVTLGPVNSGTSGNPITFRGRIEEPDEEGSTADSVILQLTSDQGPVIGTDGQNYITVEGFYIDEVNAVPWPDTGPILLHNTTGSRAQFNEVKGIHVTPADNHNGIRFQACTGCSINNNRIRNIGSGGGTPVFGQNDAGIMSYDGFQTTVENNLIYNVGAGIFIKGEHPGDPVQGSNVIRYNRIRAADVSGIRILDSQNDLIYQNIISDIRGPGASACLHVGFGTSGPNLSFINNTCYDVGFMVRHQNADQHEDTITFKNNIVQLADYGTAILDGVNTDSTHVYDRNVYRTISTAIYSGLAGDLTLTQWQASPFFQDANSVTTDPQLEDPANDDFHLEPGSPALTLGRVVFSIGGTNGDTIPVGAYITGSEVIGIDGGGAAPAAAASRRSKGRMRVRGKEEAANEIRIGDYWLFARVGIWHRRIQFSAAITTTATGGRSGAGVAEDRAIRSAFSGQRVQSAVIGQGMEQRPRYDVEGRQRASAGVHGRLAAVHFGANQAASQSTITK